MPYLFDFCKNSPLPPLENSVYISTANGRPLPIDFGESSFAVQNFLESCGGIKCETMRTLEYSLDISAEAEGGKWIAYCDALYEGDVAHHWIGPFVSSGQMFGAIFADICELSDAEILSVVSPLTPILNFEPPASISVGAQALFREAAMLYMRARAEKGFEAKELMGKVCALLQAKDLAPSPAFRQVLAMYIYDCLVESAEESDVEEVVLRLKKKFLMPRHDLMLNLLG